MNSTIKEIPTVLYYEADLPNDYWAKSETTSANIVPFVATKNGKDVKSIKGLLRISGLGNELSLISDTATVVCQKLNQKIIQPSIFDGKKSMNVHKVIKLLNL